MIQAAPDHKKGLKSFVKRNFRPVYFYKTAAKNALAKFGCSTRSKLIIFYDQPYASVW